MKKTIQEIVRPITTRYRLLGRLAIGNTPELVAIGYRWRRKSYPRTTATMALAGALIKSNPAHYYCPVMLGAPDKQGYRSVDNYAHVGLRFVEFADKLVRLNHEGWFTMDDGGLDNEVYRGCVFQIPGRRKQARYLVGYQDSAAEVYVVDFSRVYHAVSRESPMGDDNVRNIAARDADNMARIDAERECERNRYYQDADRWLFLHTQLGGDYLIAGLKRMRDKLQEQLSALEELEAIEARFPDVATYAKENL